VKGETVSWDVPKGDRGLRYGIEITPVALETLKGMKDRRIARQIAQRIDRLGDDPEKQGKPLLGELSGYRSVRAAASGTV
jgi:mRNA interferase RelE/StbE